ADAIVAAIKKSKDDTQIARLRDEGDQIFKQVEQTQRTRIQALKADPDPEKVRDALEIARLNLPRSLYFHAQLFPTGSERHLQLCKEAVTEFDEFDLDFGGG